MSNLLANAEKFTQRGGRVLVSLTADDTQAVLRVVDNGKGISPELLDRLFQPFAQAPETMDRSRGGLGLGLSMVKGLVELHGGRVIMTSAGLGRGTEMTVLMPLHDAPVAPVRIESQPPSLSQRVLVIEDNEDAADTLGHALSIIGHDVQVAYNGQTGLDLAHTFHPGIVFCDVGLPGMDGYEVARAFRDDADLRSIYLIALTGYVQPEDLERAAAAGFDQHVAKPPSVGHLSRILAEAAKKPLH